ncbi:MAG: hypothetical protein RL537_70 [Actinomycetota bacterium]
MAKPAESGIIVVSINPKESYLMAAMKPRTGDGPMEAEREPRGLIVLRVPLEGGGRLVVSVNEEEAKQLHKVLAGVIKK